jgi:hypothetical protein
MITYIKKEKIQAGDVFIVKNIPEKSFLAVAFTVDHIIDSYGQVHQKALASRVSTYEQWKNNN